MLHASLFSGIGGFDLAAHWVGWTTLFQVERDEFCRKVLAHHFPDTARFADIHDFNGKTTARYAGRVDVLSGGFPCQPYSHAGQRRGTDDHRHLWPEMLRVIREVRPRWVVGENVRGLLTWNDGLVVDEILADLEGAGYRCFPPLIVPACGQNAPHRRDRVWFVAYADGTERSGRNRGKHESAAARIRRDQEGDVLTQCSLFGLAPEPGGSGGTGAGGGLGTDAGNAANSNSFGDQRPDEPGTMASPIGSHGGEGVEAVGDAAAICSEERTAANADVQPCGEGRPEHEGQFRAGCAPDAASIGDAPDPSRITEREQGHEAEPIAVGGSEGLVPRWPGQRGNATDAEGRCDASDALGVGSEGRGSDRQQEPQCARPAGLLGRDFAGTYWTEFPTTSPVRPRNDGVPGGLVRYSDGTDSRYHAAAVESRLRKEAIKGGGNAIVPHIAVALFNAINEVEAQVAAQRAASQ